MSARDDNSDEQVGASHAPDDGFNDVAAAATGRPKDDQGLSPGAPALHFSGPPSEGIRIAALEAVIVAGLAPSTTRAPAPASQDEVLADQVPSLPDWTDPPTGQVPRILLEHAALADDAGLGPTGPGPSWREHGSDWEGGGLDLSFLGEGGRELGIATGEMSGDDLPLDLAFDEILLAPGDVGARSAGRVALGEPSTPSAAGRELDGDDDAAWASLLEVGTVTSTFDPAKHGVEPTRTRSRPVSTGAKARRGGRRGAHLAAKALAGTSPAGTRPAVLGDPPRGKGDKGARVLEEGRSRRGRVERPSSDAASPTRSPWIATSTGIGVGLVALVCFLVGAKASLVLVALVTVVAAGELLGVLRKSGYRPAAPLALLASGGLVLAAYLKGIEAFPAVLALTVVLGLTWFLFGGQGERPARDLGITLLAVAWIGGLGSFAGLLLAPARFPHQDGVALLVAAIALTVANDVGAYAAGSALGRHRLAPRVSPSKSYEGLLGGAVLTMVVAAFGVSQLRPLDTGKALVVGLAVLVLAPLGDLAESLVKRDLGRKDMGSLLPGHGGVLDRVDGILFVLPAVYYLAEAFHLA